MKISTAQKKYISLVARHTLYASLFYYLLLLVIDVLLGGVISFFFKVGALMGLVLASAIVLAFAGKERQMQKSNEDSFEKKISSRDSSQNARSNVFFYAALLASGLLLFLALRPHDTIVAALLAFLTPILAIVNKKTILP